MLEPGFVNLAQLVANQIGVAMENQALGRRAQRQLLEVQRVQQQLVRASKLGAVGELAAAVAHEVNNPLTGILGFSELLLAELPVDDPRHQEASIIQDRGRPRRGDHSIAPGVCPAAPAAADPERSQRPGQVFSGAGQASEPRKPASRSSADYGELPRQEIDPDALKQVLVNLFNNAVEAMPRGGELHVSTRTVGDRIAVMVADNGIGMDAGTQSHIFTPFFSTRAAAGGGTGLGLSVSLQIVESHGGTIEVESRLAEGSVFTVWLPLSWAAFDGAVMVPQPQGSDTQAGEKAGQVWVAA
jgi:signal transduction histidine kinase